MSVKKGPQKPEEVDPRASYKISGLRVERPDIDTSSAGSASTRRKSKKYILKASRSPRNRPHPCRELFNAVAIYAICISLPTLFGILVRWYEYWFSITRAGNLEKNNYEGYDLTSFLYGEDVIWSPYFITGRSDARHLLELPNSIYIFVKRQVSLYVSNHDHALSDAQFIMALSIFLSLVRVLLVFIFVPRYLAPRRLAVLVHSKSTHLLSSSEYEFAKIENKEEDINMKSGYRHLMKSFLESFNNFWIQTGDSFRRSLGHEAQTPYDDLDATQALRLFTAPRYATGIFRLLCCLLSSCYAFIKFSNSEFWPIWVGGLKTAQTKNCWDLGGSVALKGADFDHDFDNQNSALRYFFLGQASYQIHSLCFHFLSMILLLVWGGNDGYLSARKSLKSYMRPMIEHTLYFVLTVTTYIFSGLRRLGAISIFAQETSSIIIQVLQICINAPKESRLRSPQLIKIVHRFVVVPIFVYFRFFVMPFIVQYSAALESSKWLQQIEHLLTPGCGVVIYFFFNGMLMIAFVLNLVYLRRLLFHPYVRELSERYDIKLE